MGCTTSTGSLMRHDVAVPDVHQKPNTGSLDGGDGGGNGNGIQSIGDSHLIVAEESSSSFFSSRSSVTGSLAVDDYHPNKSINRSEFESRTGNQIDDLSTIKANDRTVDMAEEEVDIDLNDPEVGKAAVKIQAGFKNFMASKKKPPTSTAGNAEDNPAAAAVAENPNGDQKEKSDDQSKLDQALNNPAPHGPGFGPSGKK